MKHKQNEYFLEILACYLSQGNERLLRERGHGPILMLLNKHRSLYPIASFLVRLSLYCQPVNNDPETYY